MCRARYALSDDHYCVRRGGFPLSQFSRLSLIIVDSIERHGEIIARLKLFQAGYLDYQPPSIYNELPESAYLISFAFVIYFFLYFYSLCTCFTSDTILNLSPLIHANRMEETISKYLTLGTLNIAYVYSFPIRIWIFGSEARV